MASASIDFLPKVDWDNFQPTYEDYDKIKRNAIELARLTLDVKKLKVETLEWAQGMLVDTEIAALEMAEDWRFLHIGKYHYAMNRGGILDDICLKWLDPKVEEVLVIGHGKLAEEAKKEAAKPVTIVIDHRVRDEMLGLGLAQELEELILKGIFPKDYETAYNILDHNKPSPAVLRHIVSNLQIFMDEFNDFTVQEIEEGFSSRKAFIKSKEAYVELLDLGKSYSTNAKTRRKMNRKRKNHGVGPKARAAKAVSKVNYKIEDRELRLISIDPESIVGAKGLLVYHTKNRKVGLYVAADDAGLGVKGTTIQGFDEKKSFQKTLRKPGEQLSTLRDATFKRTGIVLNKNIKAKAGTMNGRLNDHIVLLKVWKK